MARPWQILCLAALSLTACGDLRRLFPPTQGPHQQKGAGVEGKNLPAPDPSQVRQQRLGVERCLRERPGLETQMASLRQAEARLAQVKAETYASLPPPAPWNEAEESRFRLEDREADRQKYLQEQDEWKRRDLSRQRRWQMDHQERLRQAQSVLDGYARSLRIQRPDLFTGSGSIEFDPLVVHRIRQCDGAQPRAVALD